VVDDSTGQSANHDAQGPRVGPARPVRGRFCTTRFNSFNTRRAGTGLRLSIVKDRSRTTGNVAARSSRSGGHETKALDDRLFHVRTKLLVLALAGLACTPLRREDEPLDSALQEQEQEQNPIVMTGLDPSVDLDCFDADVELRSPFAPHHDDLRLELVATAVRFEPGEPVPLRASIHNDGDAGQYVVLPGDGSEVGWREPHVWVSTLSESSPGCWQPLPAPRIVRCGLYNRDWTRDVVAIAPGESRDVELRHRLALEQAGRVRVRAHYLWNEGRTTKGDAPAVRSPSVMAGVPAFELTSNAVELVIERPLELELEPRPRSPGARVPTDVRELVDVRITNVTDAPQRVIRPAASVLRFELEGSVTTLPRGTWEHRGPARTVTLGPGASVDLLGAQSPNPELEYFIDHPVAERVRLRATFRPRADRPDVRITSQWVEVDLRTSAPAEPTR
jgi:hypothetical protein